MSSGVPSDREAITAALDRFEAAQAEVASLSFQALSAPEVLDVKDRLETVYRRQTAVDHRLSHQLTSQASPVDLGGKSWSDVLHNRLRIGRGEARRRLDEAEDLGPRTALTGQPLQPGLPNVAAAQAAGKIGAEQLAGAKTALEGQLAVAYAASPRSNLVVSFNAPIGTVLNYHVKPEWFTIEAAYEKLDRRRPATLVRYRTGCSRVGAGERGSRSHDASGARHRRRDPAQHSGLGPPWPPRRRGRGDAEVRRAHPGRRATGIPRHTRYPA
jgi:hypothetical protein